MAVGERLLGILKIAGFTAMLFAGTISEGIGIPLYYVGEVKKAEAQELYSNSEEYKALKELEDARIDTLKDKLEDLEVSYQAGEILAPEYAEQKKAYEEDISNSEKNFLKDNLKKSENEEVNALLKSYDAYNFAGIAFITLGGAAFLLKGAAMLLMSSPNEFCSAGTALTEIIGETFACDVAPELVEYFDRKRLERQEKKEAKKKEKDFAEDEEEELGNIEDTCYNE